MTNADDGDNDTASSVDPDTDSEYSDDSDFEYTAWDFLAESHPRSMSLRARNMRTRFTACGVTMYRMEMFGIRSCAHLPTPWAQRDNFESLLLLAWTAGFAGAELEHLREESAKSLRQYDLRDAYRQQIKDLETRIEVAWIMFDETLGELQEDPTCGARGLLRTMWSWLWYAVKYIEVWDQYIHERQEELRREMEAEQRGDNQADTKTPEQRKRDRDQKSAIIVDVLADRQSLYEVIHAV